MKTANRLAIILAIATLVSCSEDPASAPAGEPAQGSPSSSSSPPKAGAGTGTVISVDAKQYREILASESRLVIADFYADWCGPCKIIAPSLEKIASEYPDSTRVIKVDVDANGDLAGSLGIQSIPFVQFYKDGKAVDQFIGVLPYEGIVEKVKFNLAAK